jgi:hypothetical protein
MVRRQHSRRPPTMSVDDAFIVSAQPRQRHCTVENLDARLSETNIVSWLAFRAFVDGRSSNCDVLYFLIDLRVASCSPCPGSASFRWPWTSPLSRTSNHNLTFVIMRRLPGVSCRSTTTERSAVQAQRVHQLTATLPHGMAIRLISRQTAPARHLCATEIARNSGLLIGSGELTWAGNCLTSGYPLLSHATHYKP